MINELKILYRESLNFMSRDEYPCGEEAKAIVCLCEDLSEILSEIVEVYKENATWDENSGNPFAITSIAELISVSKHSEFLIRCMKHMGIERIFGFCKVQYTLADKELSEAGVNTEEEFSDLIDKSQRRRFSRVL